MNTRTIFAAALLAAPGICQAYDATLQEKFWNAAEWGNVELLDGLQPHLRSGKIDPDRARPRTFMTAMNYALSRASTPNGDFERNTLDWMMSQGILFSASDVRTLLVRARDDSWDFDPPGSERLIDLMIRHGISMLPRQKNELFDELRAGKFGSGAKAGEIFRKLIEADAAGRIRS